MCFACGSYWPWNRPTELAPPPSKDETIFLDHNTHFYPDYRAGIHSPGPVYQNNFPGSGFYGYGGMGGYGGFGNTMPFYAGAGYPYSQYGWPYSSPYHFSYSSYPSFHYYSHYNAPFPCHPTYYDDYAYKYGNIGSQLGLYAGAMPGQLHTFPTPMCPASMTSQAAAAAAANASLAQMPNGPAYWVGAGQSDYAAQQAIVAANMGVALPGGGAPSSLAPYKPADGQQFWCKEMDGSWTLRTYSEIALGDVSPGHWERHAVSGYFFWVRQPA